MFIQRQSVTTLISDLDVILLELDNIISGDAYNRFNEKPRIMKSGKTYDQFLLEDLNKAKSKKETFEDKLLKTKNKIGSDDSNNKILMMSFETKTNDINELMEKGNCQI